MPLTSISAPANLSLAKTLSFSSWPPLTAIFTPKGPKRWPTIIRMGGGPRTYPGGVSKWQWKRMQAKKAKQLLQARLSRERQIYEMRKRAELKAAVSELERPWEPVRAHSSVAASKLFSVAADEQVKVLADRFQKPGGMDLWTDRDGPQLLHTPEGFPSARFFPKGVVHSVRPYGKVSGPDEQEEAAGDSGFQRNGGEWRKGRGSGRGRGRGRINGSVPRGMEATGEFGEGRVKSRTSWDSSEGVTDSYPRLKSARQGRAGSRDLDYGEVYDTNSEDDGSYAKSRSSLDRRNSVSRSGRSGASRTTSERVTSLAPRLQFSRRGRGGRYGRGGSRKESRSGEVYDMSMANDGSYGFDVDDRGRDW